MKTLKITLVLALLLASFTSCVEQDLHEDDTLQTEQETETAPATGGDGDQ